MACCRNIRLETVKDLSKLFYDCCVNCMITFHHELYLSWCDDVIGIRWLCGVTTWTTLTHTRVHGGVGGARRVADGQRVVKRIHRESTGRCSVDRLIISPPLVPPAATQRPRTLPRSASAVAQLPAADVIDAKVTRLPFTAQSPLAHGGVLSRCAVCLGRRMRCGREAG